MQRIIEIDGDWWPYADTECRPAALAQYKDLDAAIAQCRQKEVVVQAGGNCGVFPRYLAGIFQRVYTFEPDADNFLCLNLNAKARNIIKMQAALGQGGPPITLSRTPENAGAHSVAWNSTVVRDEIPVVSIDQLNLHTCDLLQLDLEGYEYYALLGARETIKKYRPVLMIEDKGHERKYGIAPGIMHAKLASWGYKLLEKIHRDIIMVPGEL